MSDGEATRGLRSTDATGWAPIGRRWAVVVGVSEYRDTSLDLAYADRDAQAFHDLIVTPAGGNFARENIRLLKNAAATTAAVTQAVRGFLLAAVPEDLVLLFFACHGGPDTRRPAGPLYLYTHDTDRTDVAGTAFAMDEVDRSLQQLIQAKRVVIIADTCHSGGIGGGPGTRADVSAEATNRYLEAMARAKGGVALLTSAEAAESSLEDVRWGGGHGVFTHYLLEGIRGAADGFGGEKDGIVSIGELFEYVRDQVQADTDGRQHPAIGTTQFDRKLPMAVTGDLDVEQHLALGRVLAEVGWMLDDPAPMLLAARQFGLAADLKRGLPAADAERGSCLLAAGRADEAAAVLGAAIATAPDELPATAWRDLGLAEAERGRRAPAADAFAAFLERDGSDAPWIGPYRDWLAAPPGRFRALLLGVGTYPPKAVVSPLPGVAADVEMVAELMRTTFDVPPERLATCLDSAATVEGMAAALDSLAAAVTPDDIVVVYFTGHAVPTAGADDPYLVAYADHRDGAVGPTPSELMTALDLNAREVVLILDTHVSPALVALAGQQERLVTLLGCGVGELAYEVVLDGVGHGLFTASLVEELRRPTDGLTYRGLVEAARRRMRLLQPGLDQTPLVAGTRDAPLFVGRSPDADLWRGLRRWVPRAGDERALRRAAEHLDLPAARRALARRARATGDPDRALAELDGTGDAGAPEATGDATLHALALLEAGRADEARSALAAGGAAPDESLARVAALLAAGPPARPAVCALAPLTGVAPEARAARVEELRAAVADASGAPAATVEVYGPDLATVAAARRVLAAVADASAPTVVVLACSTAGGGAMRYVFGDGTLAAPEVAGLTAGAGQVVAVLELDIRPDMIHRDIGLPALQLVADTGFPTALVSDDPAATRRLLAALPDVWAAGGSFADWAARGRAPGAEGLAAVEVLPAARATAPLAAHATAMLARRMLEQAQRRPATAASELARAAIERRRAQHEEHPEGHLQLGLALAAAGRPADALAVLRTARNLYDDPSVAELERIRDPSSERWHLEARYHVGRLQYEYGDDLFDAVASLQAAARHAGDDPRVQLHLALAIRAMVERETLVEARRYASRYLELGAPLGHGDELRDFVLEGPDAPG